MITSKKISKISIGSIRPTQLTVGFHEVKLRKEKFKGIQKEELIRLLKRKSKPVVLGPNKKLYLIDGHHLARSLLESGIDWMYVHLVADLSSLSSKQFWKMMDKRSWVYPYNEVGIRQDFASIPRSIEDLKDDPYRSLAWLVRKEGGFEKSDMPFHEFKWANLFRRKIVLSTYRRKEFKSVLKTAIAIATSSSLR